MSNKPRHGSSSPWASDESTQNLLGSILEDTLDAATQEAEQLDHAIMESTRHHEEEKRAQELARQRANAQAIAKEEDRQREAEKRRTAALQAINASEHEEAHEPVVPAAYTSPEPVAPAPMMLQPIEPLPQRRGVAAQPPPPAARRTSPVMLATMGAIAIALVAAMSLLAALTLTGYQVDQTSYPKTLMQPRSAKDPLTSASYQPIPKPAAIIVKDVEPSAEPSKKSSGSRKAPATAPAEKPSSKKDRIKDIFKEDDSNIFGTVDKFGSDL